MPPHLVCLCSCADALEAVGSQLHQLRVQFHLELAKGEVDADFLAKVCFSPSLLSLVGQMLGCPVMQASADLDKAISLDYTIPLDRLSERQAFWLPACFLECFLTWGPCSEQKSESPEWFQRPLDRFLYPLHRKLEVKQDLYRDPET